MQTFDDALNLKSALEDLILALAGNTSSPEDLFARMLSTSQQKFTLDYLSKKKVDLSNRSSIRENLKELQSDLGKAVPLDIVLAVDPDNALRSAVALWLSTNVGSMILPKYSVNKSYIGGARLTYNGIYLDLSLRRKLNELSILKAAL